MSAIRHLLSGFEHGHDHTVAFFTGVSPRPTQAVTE
jgi:hypothetical protein